MSDTNPTRWLLEHEHLLPPRGDALDVACGRGRNALWMGARGLRTLGLDRDAAAVQFVRDEAERQRIDVRAEVVDLESGAAPVAADAYDVIVVVHYLYRPLFPALRAGLRPGGILVYETFTRGQEARGHPRNPAFLLEPGELRALVQPLAIVVEREGDFEGKLLASVIARRS
jgi:SAM-dependent methyltransferase